VTTERRAWTGEAAAPIARAGRFGAYSAFAGLAVGAFVGPLDGSMVNSMLPVLGSSRSIC
jgi:hypothetical protein